MRPPTISVVLTLCTLPAASGCEGNGEGAAAALASVPLDENPAPDSTIPLWTVDPDPVLVIGGRESSPLFLVRDAARLSDGRIVVANGRTELRFHGPDARHLLSAGRKGRGPGEFVSVSQLMIGDGDTIFAWDASLQRLSVFSPSGELVRTHLADLGGENVILKHRFADGTFLAQSSFSNPRGYAEGEVARVPGRALRFRPDLSGSETVLRYPGLEFHFRGRAGYGALPFGRTTWLAGSDSTFYVGTMEHGYEIRLHAADGRPLRRIRLAVEPVPAAPAMEVRLERARATMEPQALARYEARVGDAPIPVTIPPHGPMIVDSEGNLWVGEYVQTWSTVQPREYTVFDARGRVAATVRVPPSLWLREVGADWLLGIQRDSMDVERVVLHRVRKP